MYCNKCGSQIADDAVICIYCGAPTHHADEHTQPIQPYQQNQTSTQTNTPAIIGFIFAFIFPIVGLICSIIGLQNAPKCNGSGKGIAIAGIIISALEILVVVIFVCIILGSLGVALDDLMSVMIL